MTPSMARSTARIRSTGPPLVFFWLDVRAAVVLPVPGALAVDDVTPYVYGDAVGYGHASRSQWPAAGCRRRQNTKHPYTWPAAGGGGGTSLGSPAARLAVAGDTDRIPYDQCRINYSLRFIL